MNIAVELARNDLMVGLSAEDVSLFAGIAVEAKFGPRETVYEAKSAGDTLFAIAEGSFSVLVPDENGDDVEVASLKPNSYFGEMGLIDGMVRTAAVVSDGDCRCYRFNGSALFELLRRNDRVAAVFYRNLCRGFARRLRDTTRNMGYFKARADR